MKFYPSDWRADPALRMCSIGARGLWMEMLCLMHEAEPYGSLRINGNAVTDRQLASLAGIGASEVVELIGELELSGVLSRDADGVITSRRMQRDKAKAEADKANGKRGGNPGLREWVNPHDNGQDKAQKPEARSQSSSLRSDEPAPAKPTPRQHLETVLDADRADALIAHRQRIRKPLTPHAADLLARKLAQCSDPNAAADAIIVNGWQGFEPQWLENRQSRAGPRPQQANAVVGLIDQLLREPSHDGPTIDAEPNPSPARQLSGSWR